MSGQNDNEPLNNLRHSCAHLLAAAVLELWPHAKRTIGPPIENGFYYDFDMGDPSTGSGQAVKISESDLKTIEKKMEQILQTWKGFERKEVSSEEAKKLFADNPYKLELIQEFSGEGQTLTLYTSGNYIDLCRGGHSENPSKELRHFKLLSVAGAYWRGSEKNKMLTRIYGTCFPTKDELMKHLRMLEEAKRRDHRKISQEQELFMIDDAVGKGLVLWLPNGNIIKEQIENWAKETETAWGYTRVTTPHITKSGLFYTSGHLPYYKKDMYPAMVLDEGEEYYLKPMNCPFHHTIFGSRPRSYRELPLRLAEYGTCYRYESSGELFGSMRVRGFTQNDSHIYCTIEQAVEEFLNVMKLHEYYYRVLGITDYHLELALRDPDKTDKYHGDSEMWKLAERLMREAVAKTGIRMVEEVGSAAFYGPKIDFIVKSSIGREFAVSTNQIDLYMSQKFNLNYIDNSGKEQKPVIIHRAPLGSHERFIGFLIEHYGGIWPVWLSPVQVRLLPVSSKHVEGADALRQELSGKGIRADVDVADETIGKKVRNAAGMKIPYVVVVGDKELSDSAEPWMIRVRGKEDQDKMMKEEFVKKVLQEITSRS